MMGYLLLDEELDTKTMTEKVDTEEAFKYAVNYLADSRRAQTRRTRHSQKVENLDY